MKSFQTFCMVDRKRIPENRMRRHARTCSTDCQKALVKGYKKERDKRICKDCGRPCSPEQKRAFRIWQSQIQTQLNGNGHAGNSIPEAAKGILEHSFLVTDRDVRQAKAKRQRRKERKLNRRLRSSR